MQEALFFLFGKEQVRAYYLSIGILVMWMKLALLALVAFGGGAAAGYYGSGGDGAEASGQKGYAGKRAIPWVRQKPGNEEKIARKFSSVKEVLSRVAQGMSPGDWENEAPSDLSSHYWEAMMVNLTYYCEWAKVDFEAACRYLDKQDGGPKDFYKEYMISALAETDPAAAAKAWQERDDNASSFLQNTEGKIARLWAMKAPDEAWTWIKSLEDKHNTTTVRGSFFRGLSEGQSLLMASFGNRLDENSQRASFVKIWAGNSPEEALKWINECNISSGEKNLLKQRYLVGLAGHNRDQALKELDMVPQEMHAQVIMAMAENMLVASGERETLDFLSGKLSRESRGMPDTISEYVRSWAQKDPSSAAEWLDSQPDGKWKELSRKELAMEMVRTDMEGAMSQAASLRDKKESSETMERVFEKNYHLQPRKSAEWLSSLQDETLRADLEKVVERINKEREEQERKKAE